MSHPAQSTLFLHEDILAQTLSYEKQLLNWRIEEIEAGRGDPGRPSYETVSDHLFKFLLYHGISILGLRRHHKYSASLSRWQRR